MMNPEVKELWCQALESGQYKQCRGRLRYTLSDGTFSYCCLGVLCELYRQTHPESQPWENDIFYQNDLVLPNEVRAWADLNRDNPIIPNCADSSSLGSINDGYTTMDGERIPSKDFAQISALIRENL